MRQLPSDLFAAYVKVHGLKPIKFWGLTECRKMLLSTKTDEISTKWQLFLAAFDNSIAVRLVFFCLTKSIAAPVYVDAIIHVAVAVDDVKVVSVVT